MNETKNKTCQFKSKYDPNYKCPEPPLEDSQKGYCIFHKPNKTEKEIKLFKQKITHKLQNKDYVFTGYHFPTGTTFRNQRFEKNADFGESTFEGDAFFRGSTFEGYADFGGSTFGESTFEKDADFRESTFEIYADFRESTFDQSADFGGSTFEGDADFRESTFEEDAGFREAIFKEVANFVETTFKNTGDFRTAIFEKVIFLDNVKIEDPKNADILFRKAKIAWHREGNYVEEGKCHYWEMDYVRKQQNWFVRYIWGNLAHRLLHGYGEHPGRVIAWAGVIITTCALLFMNFGIGETRLIGANLPTYNIFKILPKLYTLSWTDLANIGRYFYFSVVTFTTLGYGDLRPVHPISHLISSIEAFTGMFMMALFVLTFGRKWRR